MHWYEAAGLVALGLLTGAYGTMVGLGGGFLLVPAFLLLHYDSRVAAGTSMVAVLANACSGSITYLRQRRADVRSGAIFAIAGIPGAFLGAVVDQRMPQRLFAALFAALLVWVGTRLLTTSKTSHAEIADETTREDEPRPGLLDDSGRGLLNREFRDARGVRHAYKYNVAGAVIVSLGSGFIASVFGIGGGLVQVPAMVYLFGFPAHIATATSHLIIAITSVFGVASHAFYGDVEWPTALLVGAGAVMGAQIGARIAPRVPAGPLMKLLAAGVLVTAARLVWDALT